MILTLLNLMTIFSFAISRLVFYMKLFVKYVPTS